MDLEYLYIYGAKGKIKKASIFANGNCLENCLFPKMANINVPREHLLWIKYEIYSMSWILLKQSILFISN